MTESYYIPKKQNIKKSNRKFFSKVAISEDSLNKKTKVKQKDLLIFFKQLSVILKSGVPLAEGLDLLSENMTNKEFAKCIKIISEKLSSGEDLSSALKIYKGIFNPITIGLIEAGEAGGILPEVLERIAALLEANAKIKSEIKSSLIYPVIILVLAITVSLGLLIFIVPTFEDMFKDMGATLPALTRFMLATSRFVTSSSFVISTPLIIFSLIYAFKTTYQTYNGRLLIDQIILKIPLFGTLILMGELASLCDTLSTLLKAGIPLVDGLEKCINASGNQPIKNALKKSINVVKNGNELSYSLTLSKVIPKLIFSMVKIGEESGELVFMLNNLAMFYKRELEESVNALTKAMEPAIIFVVAAIVGTIVISLYLPMFEMINAAGGA